MRLHHVIPGGVVGLLLTACLTGHINSAMETWVGRHYSELIDKWGPPQTVYDNDQGGRILLYTGAGDWTSPAEGPPKPPAQSTPADAMIWDHPRPYSEYAPPENLGYTIWRMFRIDSTGYVRSYSWKGP